MVLLVDQLLDELPVVDLVWILRQPVVDLTAHLVVVAVEDEVALGETARHTADFLDASSVVLPLLVVLYQVFLMLHQQLHLSDVVETLGVVESQVGVVLQSFLFLLLLLVLLVE